MYKYDGEEALGPLQIRYTPVFAPPGSCSYEASFSVRVLNPAANVQTYGTQLQRHTGREEREADLQITPSLLQLIIKVFFFVYGWKELTSRCLIA